MLLKPSKSKLKSPNSEASYYKWSKNVLKRNHKMELFTLTHDCITKVHCVSGNRNLVVDIHGEKCLIKGKLFNQLSLGKSEQVAIVKVDNFDLPLVKTLKF